MAGSSPVPVRRDRLLPLLPPLLLAAVALVQFGLAHTTPLTPWKLGGFGMFSTFDNSRTRTVRLRLETDDGMFGVVGPRGARRTRAWPYADALRSQARRAACRRWRLIPLDAVDAEAGLSPSWPRVYGDAVLRTQSDLSGLAVPVRRGGRRAPLRAVHADVVRIRFDGDALVPDVVATEGLRPPEACP